MNCHSPGMTAVNITTYHSFLLLSIAEVLQIYQTKLLLNISQTALGMERHQYNVSQIQYTNLSPENATNTFSFTSKLAVESSYSTVLCSL